MKKVVLSIVASLAFAPTVWAFSYDLPTYGSTVAITGSLGGTAIVTEFNSDMQNTVSSGSGVINPFLTIQKNGKESGFNTDGAMLYDQKRGGNPVGPTGFTRSLLAGDLGTYEAGSTTTGPGSYFNFALDANEPNGSNKKSITLTEFQVFRVPNSVGGSLTHYAELEQYKMFDMGNNQVVIDYSLWNGSGQNMDVLYQIPSFATNANDYIYLWTEFTGSQDGFEEWTSQPGSAPGPGPGPAPVPEPCTMMLFGIGMAGLTLCRKLRNKIKA